MKFPRFLLVALVITALAVAMSLSVSWVLTNAIATWDTEHIATVARLALGDTDVDALFETPGAPATLERWQEIVSAVAGNVPGVVRCKVWRRDGLVVWSDDAALIGKPSSVSDPDLRAALAGRVVVRLVEPARDDTDAAWRLQMLSRMSVPIASPRDGAVAGVLELRKIPSRLPSTLTQGLIIVWSTALAGAVALWFVARPAAARAPARTLRTSDQILTEIRERFGFVPPFFAPAVPTPALLENLWQQTLSAYVENPLPALFKEKLFAYLSRYCSVPYCIVCHSCALRPLGMTAADVLALLESPSRTESEILGALTDLAASPGPLPEWPAPGSPLDEALLAGAIFMFREPERAGRTQAEMRRLLGPTSARLTEFLAYIKTCHVWVEAHPELAYEADQRARDHLGPLLEREARLAEFFRDYAGLVLRERHSAEARRIAELEARAAELARTNDALRARAD